MKSKADDLAGFNTTEVIANAEDLKNSLEGKIAVRLYLHTEDDIARVLQQIPGTLTSRTGALQIHQLCITQDGQMSTRKMPADRINVRVRSNADAAATAPEVSRDAELQDSPDLIPEQ